jgi:hypothetical protein
MPEQPEHSLSQAARQTGSKVSFESASYVGCVSNVASYRDISKQSASFIDLRLCAGIVAPKRFDDIRNV